MNLVYIEDLLSIIDPVVAIEYFILKKKSEFGIIADSWPDFNSNLTK